MVLRKALFLDRDGVINVEKDYLYKREDVEFIDGIFELCLHYQKLGYIIVVVTNQSGIARGYYSEKKFLKLSAWMVDEFLDKHIVVQNIYHCPHHPDITGSCRCRKPNSGMLMDAKRDFDIDLQNSIIVGDKERDIEAGLNAGLCETYFFDENKKIKSSKATKIVSRLEDIYNADT
ncbi:MAG: HAD family hydrolase [Campylobacterota bacterium]|nr:HAD family hydrolase [Campylobacterota bacterium]